MRVFAISDIHLDFNNGKVMDQFGEHWHNHWVKLEQNWRSEIQDSDVVLMPGDISWAMRQEDADKDLQFVNNLPGRKVLISGNHDYWWKSTSKLNDKYQDIVFLKNDFVPIGDVAICGSRGWVCPNDRFFTPQDKKMYIRQAGRLKLSLDKAMAMGYNKIIVMLHYAPTNDKSEPSEFTNLIFKYPVQKVVYGHLHLPITENLKYLGIVDDVEFILVSGDYLNFNPMRIC